VQELSYGVQIETASISRQELYRVSRKISENARPVKKPEEVETSRLFNVKS
jgi:hypothetical protein